jgi:type IV pilus assembly protein PilA
MVKMKKLNNKGFSLVELIIVIAMMAILVGVVGTQVIPYLENSRKSKDIQVLSAWNTAGMSSYSSAAAKISSTEDYQIKITNGNVSMTKGTTGADSILRYFCDLTDLDASKGYEFDKKMESKAGRLIKSVTIDIAQNGNIITTVEMDKEGTGYKASMDFDPIENK